LAVEALQAQSMTFYLVEGNEIAFKQVYYSPTLWTGDPVKEKKFQETASKLLSLKIPPPHPTSRIVLPEPPACALTQPSRKGLISCKGRKSEEGSHHKWASSLNLASSRSSEFV